MSMVTKRLASFALSLALASTLIPIMAIPHAAADEQLGLSAAIADGEADGADSGLVAQVSGSERVTITGISRYDYAHEVLDIVNQRRSEHGLAPLALDKTLTESSMQRAAETAIYYGHIRPNGTDCLTVDPRASAENIAWGYGSPEDVVKGWYDSEKAIWDEALKTNSFGGEKLPDGWKSMSTYQLSQDAPDFYSAVGHYLNIIEPSFKSMGVGCFSQGSLCWEQLFSTSSSTDVAGTSVNSYSYDIDINYGFCGDKQAFNPNINLSYVNPLKVGDSFQMEYALRKTNASGACVIDADCATWKSSNEKVCTVGQKTGLVKAVAPGSATITATLPSGNYLSYEWKVGYSLEAAVVSAISSQTYTGSAITPQPTVTLDGKQLVKDKDYTLTYYNNVNASTAARDMPSVAINGIGNYSGTKNVRFEITRAPITSAVLNQTSYVYNGSSQLPGVTVKAGSKVLKRMEDGSPGNDFVMVPPSNTTDAGTKSVTIVGTNNYTGTFNLSYTIAPAQLSSVELSQTKFAYDGTEKRPTLIVRANGEVLTSGYRAVFNESGLASIGTKTITITGYGNYAGTLNASYEVVEPGTPGVPADPPAATETMYRLYNPNSGEHFYTASALERDAVIAAGWDDEGVGWTAPTSGIKVYRLYNSFAGEHHYTTSEAERDMLVSVGWTWEEGGWYSDPAQGMPLYRLYNPNAFANNHHYTKDAGERDILLSMGWQNEDIGWYGIG